MPKHSFGIRAAARLSGLNPAMVDYLCRSAVLVPTGRAKPGRGRGRQYTFGDIVMLRALAQFLSCGISVAKLKTALEKVRERHHQITPKSLPGSYLVTDGRKLFFTDRGALEDINGQLAFAFVIKLHRVRDDVVEVLRKFSATNMTDETSGKHAAKGTR